MTRVLVTGSDGQLGMCIREIQSQYPGVSFCFTNKEELDITKKGELKTFFSSNKIDWCINCAAYTNVDKAEEEPDKARRINTKGPQVLAEVTNKYNVSLIHVSTDFVFDGKQKSPYKENDKTNPVNIYGKTKLEGEQKVAIFNPQHFIIRTSWLYSKYNRNFLKTMLNIATEKKKINVVSDQFGSPTNATDLAQAFLKIISSDSKSYGIYHYSNEGVVSWFEFAKTIFKEKQLNIELKPIETKNYITLAKRPLYSVLDKTKIKKTFNLDIPFWKDSLKSTIFDL